MKIWPCPCLIIFTNMSLYPVPNQSPVICQKRCGSLGGYTCPQSGEALVWCLPDGWELTCLLNKAIPGKYTRNSGIVGKSIYSRESTLRLEVGETFEGESSSFYKYTAAHSSERGGVEYVLTFYLGGGGGDECSHRLSWSQWVACRVQFFRGGGGVGRE